MSTDTLILLKDIYSALEEAGSSGGFRRNKVSVAEVDTPWQADLVDRQQFSKHNDGVKYFLTVTDRRTIKSCLGHWSKRQNGF